MTQSSRIVTFIHCNIANIDYDHGPGGLICVNKAVDVNIRNNYIRNITSNGNGVLLYSNGCLTTFISKNCISRTTVTNDQWGQILYLDLQKTKTEFIDNTAVKCPENNINACGIASFCVSESCTTEVTKNNISFCKLAHVAFWVSSSVSNQATIKMNTIANHTNNIVYDLNGNAVSNVYNDNVIGVKRSGNTEYGLFELKEGSGKVSNTLFISINLKLLYSGTKGPLLYGCLFYLCIFDEVKCGTTKAKTHPVTNKNTHYWGIKCGLENTNLFTKESDIKKNLMAHFLIVVNSIDTDYSEKI